MRAMRVMAAGVILMLSGAALADDQLVPTAQEGDWIAAEHRDSITDPPDVCLASNSPSMPTYMIIFRASSDGMEVRVLNNDWTLPVGVAGSIEMDLGANKNVFKIGANTNNMVGADVDATQLIPLFKEMDTASSLRLIVGKSAPVDISLDGSSKVLAAFATCANIKTDTSGYSNPFN